MTTYLFAKVSFNFFLHFICLKMSARGGLNARKIAIRWARKPANAKKPKPEDLVRKWNIVRGDLVQIMRGKDEGKQGVVKKVLRQRNALIVKDLNIVKKRVPATEQSKSQLVPQEAPIQYSCVALVDPKTKYKNENVCVFFFFFFFFFFFIFQKHVLIFFLNFFSYFLT